MFLEIQDVNFNRYDAIIVGSGPAGAIVAKTLAARQKNVLVLESGGREFDNLLQRNYSIVHGQGHFGSTYWPYHWIRTLGGTSAIWGGWLVALRARNMASWPITRQELDPGMILRLLSLGATR